MASTSEPAGASQIDMSEEGGTTSQAIMQSKIQEQTDVLPSSTPVEMSQLSQSPPPSHPQSDPTSATATAPTSAGASEPQTVSPISPSSDLPVLPGPAPTSPVSPTTPQTPAATTTTPAIGPGQDTNPTANTIHQTSNATSPPTTTTTTPPPDPGPSILITLILQTGKRHPFKIDLKYLRKRNIFKEDSAETDPFSISIYTLKELIWRDWREDWEARPTIPGNIRLIHFGKLLEDKQVLRDTKLNPKEPNIMHMSVKPQDFVDEEEHQKLKSGKAGSSRSRGRMGGASDDGETSAGCCRCCVM